MVLPESTKNCLFNYNNHNDSDTWNSKFGDGDDKYDLMVVTLFLTYFRNVYLGESHLTAPLGLRG